MSALGTHPIIAVLADDLGLAGSSNPLASIVQYSRQRIEGFIVEIGGCKDLQSLLTLAANKLSTRFIEIRSDGDLRQVVADQVSLGNVAVATVSAEFAAGTFGMTLRLAKREPFEPQFLSIIDARGERAARSYFTKWHELGHLLILTDQQRLAFFRSHSSGGPKPVEEKLVDLIAGEFAYYAPLVGPLLAGEPSFDRIEGIRNSICPEGSRTSALIGLVKLWPTPAILVNAQLAHRASDKGGGQCDFDFAPRPKRALRAVGVVVNEAARKRGLSLYRNFRVPQRSIIHAVFCGGFERETIENLNWWSASGGTRMGNIPVRVRARWIGDSVFAILVPERSPVLEQLSSRRPNSCSHPKRPTNSWNSMARAV